MIYLICYKTCYTEWRGEKLISIISRLIEKRNNSKEEERMF